MGEEYQSLREEMATACPAGAALQRNALQPIVSKAPKPNALRVKRKGGDDLDVRNGSNDAKSARHNETDIDAKNGVTAEASAPTGKTTPLVKTDEIPETEANDAGMGSLGAYDSDDDSDDEDDKLKL